MRRKSLLWQIYPSYVLITILSLVAVTWYATATIRQFYLHERELDLEASAQIVEKMVVGHLSTAEQAYVDGLCRDLGKEMSRRITIILPDGTVIGDSDADLPLENHANRPEIRQALLGERGQRTRRSDTVDKMMMYVAIPIHEGENIVGVARVSLAIDSIDAAVNRFYGKITVAGFVILLITALVSLVVSQRITSPLRQMNEGARCFAQGDLSARLPIPKCEELASLAKSMNHMAVELDERINTVVRQRNEQEAILSSMIEGVLAVDADETIFSMNRAAAKMLGTDRDKALGQSIQEAVRNAKLQRLVARVLNETEPVEGDIAIHDDGDRFLQAHGAILRDSHGDGMGAVVVLNDVTRLRRLENIRRDFVANVSHELKTPITSIKGFVETLQDGAVHEHDDAERFLTVIARQADRLNAIIEDLLLLSKLEQDGEQPSITFEKASVHEILEAAAQICSIKAEEKQVNLDIKCDSALTAEFNAPLLEQAVVNLIDNAVKFSESGQTVEISATNADGETVVRVRDWGTGIAEKHQPRLFERFYRVDKARSRKMGGTGLGLAIVKHIAQVHNGKVEVESKVGEGSTFSIHIPQSKD